MTDFRVGQVLFIIPAESANVVPVLIMERRISETVEGTAVKHIVKSPKPKAQPMVLETIKGMIFSDLKTARETMVRNATAAIDAMIKHASNVAQQAFAPKQPALPAPLQHDDDDPFDTSDVLIDEAPMNGGGNHAMSAPMPPQQPPMSYVQDVLETGDGGMTEVMGPNGVKQRVRLKMS